MSLRETRDLVYPMDTYTYMVKNLYVVGSLITYSLHSHLNWITLLTIVMLWNLVYYGFGTELAFGYRN